jgi:hypothetical protein
MDPVTLIVSALATGAAQAVSETTSASIKGAYESLKAKVRARFAGSPSRELVLVEHEKNPPTWQAPMVAALTETGAESDPAVVEAAQQLMALLDATGTQSGKYWVDVRGAHGVQVGDHNTQTNTFAGGVDQSGGSGSISGGPR